MYPCILIADGRALSAQSVVLTTGTFLRGTIFIGLARRPAGRIGDAPAVGLARTLERAGFRLGRLKTGTPARLHRRSIDWARTTAQPPDMPPLGPVPFSFLNARVQIEVRVYASQ